MTVVLIRQDAEQWEPKEVHENSVTAQNHNQDVLALSTKVDWSVSRLINSSSRRSTLLFWPNGKCSPDVIIT